MYVASLAVAARHEGGSDAAAALVAGAAGHRLDPTISKAFLDDPESTFDAIDRDTSLWDATIAADPQPATMVDAPAIDESLRAVADFVDLKSPWLGGHSSGVASLAATASQNIGLPTEQVRAVRRAGWLHDVGRIGVSAGIWARDGRLTPHEWEQVRLHPYYTERVLSRTPMLSRLASIASAHHERLDGSGYHRAAKAAELSVTARILATADAFHTKLEARPHRAALSAEEAAKDVRAAASAGRLDGDAVEAVLAASGQPTRRRASANDRWTYSTRDRDTPAGGPRTHNSTDSAHHDDCPKNGRRKHPAGLREDRYVDQGWRNPLRAAARPPGALGRLAQRQGVLPVVAPSAAAKTEVKQSTRSEEKMIMSQLSDLVQRHYDGAAAGDTARAADGFDENVVTETPNGVLHGLEAFKAMGDAFLAGVPDQKMTIRHIYEAGDTVIVEGDYAGTANRSFGRPVRGDSSDRTFLLFPIRRRIHRVRRQGRPARRVLGQHGVHGAARSDRRTGAATRTLSLFGSQRSSDQRVSLR